MIDIISDNKEIPVQWIEFSDGALTCRLDKSIKDVEDYISLSVHPSTPVKQITEEMSLTLDALNRMVDLSEVETYLYLPYLPYGRADRVFEEGNPNPLDGFQELLEIWNFDAVFVHDPHNPTVLRDTIKYEIKSQLRCFLDTIADLKQVKWDYVVAPDKGAKDKAKEIADFLKIPLLQADKKRDLSTGRIKKVNLYDGITF